MAAIRSSAITPRPSGSRSNWRGRRRLGDVEQPVQQETRQGDSPIRQRNQQKYDRDRDDLVPNDGLVILLAAQCPAGRRASGMPTQISTAIASTCQPTPGKQADRPGQRQPLTRAPTVPGAAVMSPKPRPVANQTAGDLRAGAGGWGLGAGDSIGMC